MKVNLNSYIRIKLSDKGINKIYNSLSKVIPDSELLRKAKSGYSRDNEGYSKMQFHELMYFKLNSFDIADCNILIDEEDMGV